MLPTRETAEKLLQEAEACNPGRSQPRCRSLRGSDSGGM